MVSSIPRNSFRSCNNEIDFVSRTVLLVEKNSGPESKMTVRVLPMSFERKQELGVYLERHLHSMAEQPGRLVSCPVKSLHDSTAHSPDIKKHKNRLMALINVLRKPRDRLQGKVSKQRL